LIDIVDLKKRRRERKKKANESKILEKPYLTNIVDLKVKERKKRVEEDKKMT
jgi:hypothetical protein